MTEPERSGGKTRLVPITSSEAHAIEADDIGGPKIYETHTPTHDERVVCVGYYAEPGELARWRSSRQPVQAGGAR